MHRTSLTYLWSWGSLSEVDTGGVQSLCISPPFNACLLLWWRHMPGLCVASPLLYAQLCTSPALPLAVLSPLCLLQEEPDPPQGESNRPLTPILLKSIAIHLPFLSRCFGKSMPSSWQKVADTLPICITIQLPFVSRYLCRSIRVRGRWNTRKDPQGVIS